MSLVFSASVWAQPSPQQKYATCLSEAHAKEKVELAKCAAYQGEAAVSACIARNTVGEAAISYCKLKSGIILATHANTLKEEQAGAQAQAEYEKSLGIGIVANRWSLDPDIDSQNLTQPEESSSVPKPRAKPSTEAPSVAKSAGSAPSNSSSGPVGRGGTGSSTTSVNSSSAAPRESASSAQAQVSADLARCESAQSEATRCCNNPLSCASSSEQANLRKLASYANRGDSQGLAAACNDMQGMGDSSGDLNISLGAICTNNHYACSNTCSSLASKYRSLMASQSDSEVYAIYSSAESALSSRSSFCGGLSARADALSNQGLSTASNSAYGDYCQRMASVAPQMANGSTSGSRAGLNPNNPNSVASAEAAAEVARGEAGFKNRQDSSSSNSFNLQDTGDTSPGQVSAVSGDGRALAYPQVANNSGTQIPGDQSGGAQAQLAANSRARGESQQQGARNYTTSIEQGYRSGGYSAPAMNGDVFPMSYGSPSVRQVAANEDPHGYKGMDLKQFLPGGSRDPGRRLAGASEKIQINAKEENIWKRISNKMYEKCKLGILWRCN